MDDLGHGRSENGMTLLTGIQARAHPLRCWDRFIDSVPAIALTA